MNIIDLKTGGNYALAPDDAVSLAIGNFDGVHLGHRKLLSIAAKKENGITKSAVWTFSEPSSRKLGGVSLLTSPEERYEIFKNLGIELLFLADFDEVCSLDPEAFVRDIIIRECHAKRAVCGFNFRYGKMAAGNAETLTESMARLGAKTEVVPAFQLNGVTVSSSEIRLALASGDTQKASQMLARPYSLTTEIVHGKKLGRTLGFPTANQPFPSCRAVPKYGVYAVRVKLDGKYYNGVANVGVRPTVENTQSANCETYLFDFRDELYGKTATTEFWKFLRPECRFSDVETLKNTVLHDMETAKNYFQKEFPLQ